jgi:2-methylcitrate dehydratase PrpD
VTAEGTITARLADPWRTVTLDDLPAEAVEVSRHCILDWIGCALAGSREPLTEILAARVAAAEPGTSTLVGLPGRAALRTAALMNGAAGHALDFDDTHTMLSGHPTVPVLPAVLALAERDDRSGADLLSAFIAGVEVECRIGALLAPGHYRAGWHATGTIGVFGAAAACAHLLGLDATEWEHALGLAGTQSAGLKATFGTMGKPMHAGKAAADGLLAALLASGGFTGDPAVIEAPQGLAAASGAGGVDIHRLDRYDGRFVIRTTLFKYHAACYLTHAAINAALKLRDDVKPADVDRIEVRVAPEVLDVCNIGEPRTGLEGKFSLRTTTAMALLGDDTSDLAAYSDERMAAADLVALRDKVVVVPTGGRPATSATLVAHIGDRRVEAEDDTGVAADDLVLQWHLLSAKFRALATPIVGADAADAIHAAVTRIESLRSVRELLALTV